jgi:BolA protein
MELATRLRELLEAALDPTEIVLDDLSDRHRGHPGATGGGGHFRLRIVSNAFEGLPLLDRHRRVYAAVGDLMGAEVHALSIDARTPGEVGR